MEKKTYMINITNINKNQKKEICIYNNNNKSNKNNKKTFTTEFMKKKKIITKFLQTSIIAK